MNVVLRDRTIKEMMIPAKTIDSHNAVWKCSVAHGFSDSTRCSGPVAHNLVSTALLDQCCSFVPSQGLVLQMAGYRLSPSTLMGSARTRFLGRLVILIRGMAGTECIARISYPIPGFLSIRSHSTALILRLSRQVAERNGYTARGIWSQQELLCHINPLRMAPDSLEHAFS